MDAADFAEAPGARYNGAMHPNVLFLLTVLILLALFLLWRLRAVRHRPPKGPYVARGALLSRGELVFHRVLLAVVPRGVVVCPKVRLADVIACQPRDCERYGRPLPGKHVNFVLADAATTAILLVVELDDRTHRQPERQARDRLVDAALASAAVPVLHVTAAARYEVREIGSRVEKALKGKG
jgi:hypothetical protein